MAENYFVLRQMDEAQKQYEQLCKFDQTLPNLHLELGQVFAMTSRWPQAESNSVLNVQHNRETPKPPIDSVTLSSPGKVA